MKAPERDQLLIRLDERTNNIWRVVDQMEQHQAEQNDHILTALTLSKGNRTWISVFRWVGGIIGVAVFATLGWIVERLI